MLDCFLRDNIGVRVEERKFVKYQADTGKTVHTRAKTDTETDTETRAEAAMAKQSQQPKRLSDRFIKNVKEPGVYSDGRGAHGLQLRVTESAAGGVNKYFQQRLTLHGKEINVGIGSYSLVTLAQAREEAPENAKKVRAGIDPRGVNRSKSENVPTFAEAAELVISERVTEWKKGSSTEKTWRGIFRREAFPKIGHLPVDVITERHIIDMIGPVWQSKRRTAISLFGNTKQVMAWCRREDYRTDNPVNDAVKEHLSRSKHKVKHLASVPYYEVGAALRAIRGYGGADTTKLAMEFQIQTAARHGSIRSACWGEIDWKNKVWIIPAEQMKMEEVHRIPLSGGAIAVLNEARLLRTSDSDLIFPSRKGGGIINETTLLGMCKALNLSGVPHGFRASFATWCGEKGVPQELAEAALAHTPDAIVQAYTRTDYLDRRKPLMQFWSDYIEGKLAADWEWSGGDSRLLAALLETQRLLVESQAQIAAMVAEIAALKAAREV